MRRKRDGGGGQRCWVARGTAAVPLYLFSDACVEGRGEDRAVADGLSGRGGEAVEREGSGVSGSEVQNSSLLFTISLFPIFFVRLL